MDSNKMVEYNFVGNSGLKVSNICLGTSTFGKEEVQLSSLPSIVWNEKQCDEETSHKLMDRFVELGGNFIDTANMYAVGKTERIVGSWLQKQNRDNIVISTKCRYPMTMDDWSKPNAFGLSRRHIIKSCEDSLNRLQTNYIDLYQAHVWDNETPVEETLRTFDDLIRCGKIRYFGYCNVCGWQMQKVVQETKRLGLNSCISLQQQYSLLYRHSEWEALTVCDNEGIGVLTWSPLKKGLLTGKYKRDQIPDPKKSRIGYMASQQGSRAPVVKWERLVQNDSYWNMLEVMEDIAKTHGKTVAQVAIRWLLQRKMVTSVIIGATSMQHLEDNMGAGRGWQLSEDEMKKLCDASDIEATYPYDLIHVQSLSDKSFKT